MLPTIEETLVDVNGVPFVQDSVFSFRKNVGLYIRISQQTKADIEYLCRKDSVSQSDLITVLVAERIKNMKKEI